MTDVHAAAITREALALRASHPWAPALDLLDLVMRARHGATLDFGSDGIPPVRFALIIAEAFDRGMTPLEWAAFTGPTADPAFRTSVLQIWHSEVWPRFVDRYRLAPP